MRGAAGAPYRLDWRYLSSVALIFGLITAMVSSKGIVVYRYVQDLFVTVDVMWRAYANQTPHLDFPSAIGQAYYWPFLMLSWVSEAGADQVLRANALVAAVCTLLGLVALWRRLRPSLFAVAIGLVSMIALTPRDMDGGILSFSYLAPYNTWAFSFAILCVLVAGVEPRDERLSAWATRIDGVVLGLCLTTLYYLKITFFLPILALTLFFFLVGPARKVSPVALLATAATVVGLVEIAFHNNQAYVRDIGDAIRVGVGSSEGFRLGKALQHLAEAAVFGLVLVAALWIARPRERLLAWCLGVWRPLLISAAVIVTGAAIATQNHPFHQPALSVAGLVIGLELGLRPAAVAGARASLAFLSGLAVAAALPILDAASVVAHLIVSRGDTVCEMPVFRTLRPALLVRRDLTVDGRCESLDMTYVDVWNSPVKRGTKNWKEKYRARYQLQQLQDAVSLLRAQRRPGDVVFAAAFSNPFPFIFSEAPPRHSQVWWHLGRSFSSERRPDPALVFSDVTLVMEVKDGVGLDVWRVYGPYVTQHFTFVEESERWRVWRRRAPLGVEAATAPKSVDPGDGAQRR